MIYNRVLDILNVFGVLNRNQNIKTPQININDRLKDAELRQGTKYLNNINVMSKYVENNSLLMENFESGSNRNNSDNSSGNHDGYNPINDLAKQELEDLKKLEQHFQSLLTEYTTLSKTIFEDEMKFIKEEMNQYVGKNLVDSKGNKYYVNKFGEARLYPDNKTWDAKGYNCPEDTENIGNSTPVELGLRMGSDMYKGEPCGLEGHNVQIGTKQSDVVNLCSLGNAVATQSSTFNTSMKAMNAIDGNKDTFSHTHHPKIPGQQWWQVELGSTSHIKNIVLYNRYDCCQDRLSNLRVDVFDENDNITFTTSLIRTQDKQEKFQTDVNAIGNRVRITQMTAEYLAISEFQVFGTHNVGVSNGKTGYVTGEGILKMYPNGDMTNSTGSCPSGTPIEIGNDVWNSIKKGPNMNKDTLCEFGSVDLDKKTQLRELNKKMMDVANQIYGKINEAEQTIKELRSKTGDEDLYLDKQLATFKQLFDKYNSIDKRNPTIDAMMEDQTLRETSDYYTYLLIATITIVIMLSTYKIVTH